MEKSIISELESCFLVTLSPREVKSIRRESFTLPSGDTLEVGDCFTEIGSSGSAGNQPIVLTPPWVQRYQGLLSTSAECFEWLPSCWDQRDFVLFDAFNSHDLNDGYIEPAYHAKWTGTRDLKDGYYMAYLRQPDNSLFHTRGSASSSVCKGTSLTRWYPES